MKKQNLLLIGGMFLAVVFLGGCGAQKDNSGATTTAPVKSAQMPQEKVSQPGTKDLVEFSELARTGGIINAYEAVKYASTLVKAPVKKTVLPKPTFKKAKAA